MPSLMLQGQNPGQMGYSPDQPWINPDSPSVIEPYAEFGPSDFNQWSNHDWTDEELDNLFNNKMTGIWNGYKLPMGDLFRWSYEAYLKHKNGEDISDNGLSGVNTLNSSDLDEWFKVYRQLYDEYLSLQDKYFNKEMEFNQSNQDKVNEMLMDLSKNAISYRVEDLKRAGINPLLAIDQLGGIDVPSLGAASASAPNFSYLNPQSLLSAEISKLKQDRDLFTDILSAIAGIFKVFVGSYKGSFNGSYTTKQIK